MTLPKLVGVVHLPALAGSPGSHGYHPAEALQKAGFQAVQDARSYLQAGFEGILIQNYGDFPYFHDKVPHEAVASMAILGAAMRETVPSQLGIQILGNDPFAAFGIAAVTGTDFILVDSVTRSAQFDALRHGHSILGEAPELLRERERLHADVSVLWQLGVSRLGLPLLLDWVQLIEEMGTQGMADGVVVSDRLFSKLTPDLITQMSQAAREYQIPFYFEFSSSKYWHLLSEYSQWIDGAFVHFNSRKTTRSKSELDLKRLKMCVQEFKKEFNKQKRKKGNKIKKA